MNVIIKYFMETFRKINTNYKYFAKIYIKCNTTYYLEWVNLVWSIEIAFDIVEWEFYLIALNINT